VRRRASSRKQTSLCPGPPEEAWHVRAEGRDELLEGPFPPVPRPRAFCSQLSALPRPVFRSLQRVGVLRLWRGGGPFVCTALLAVQGAPRLLQVTEIVLIPVAPGAEPGLTFPDLLLRPTHYIVSQRILADQLAEPEQVAVRIRVADAARLRRLDRLGHRHGPHEL
jgi:hypothetical protein